MMVIDVCISHPVTILAFRQSSEFNAMDSKAECNEG
jgi:hypothetical protein